MENSLMNILICEDEDDIRNLLKIHIETAGFNALEAKNGIDAIELAKASKIHLILLDIMMPFKNGFEVVKELRSNNNNIPIIILTARIEDDNKILGLDLGADDYMCKPFNYREVLSRINAQLRRYFNFQSQENKIYRNGPLTLDVGNFLVTNGSNTIYLNPQEFKLLEIFISSPGRVFTKEQLYEKAWESEYISDDNTLMVHISRLRDKLKCGNSVDYIETIRGLGYRMIKIEK